MSDQSCSRCGRNPRVPKQRWCGPCRAEYKRMARSAARGTVPTEGNGENGGNGGNGVETPASAALAKGSEEEIGRKVVAGSRPVPPKTSEPAAVPPAPYVPFTGTQAAREPWYRAFLADLAINGGMSLAAAAAGVHRRRVQRAIERDPVFADEVEVAKEYYVDLLEWESVNLARRRHNPLPFFARLKAELPARYIDRQAVLVASTSPQLNHEEGVELLRTMLWQATPTTRQVLAPLADLGGGKVLVQRPIEASPDVDRRAE